jgi:MYXO-CTERM domain-containing protein
MARATILVTLVAAAGLVGGLVFACVSPESEDSLRGDVTPAPEGWIPAPLAEAFCDITVEGTGSVALETDYLPHVITCENGGANLEALKAQAIAARSVAYYYIVNYGSVCDSQGCQVYSCGSEPSAMAIQAVEETSGIYMNFNEVLTYAFYVAGDSDTSPPGCVGNVNVGTEHWVTYNQGQSGDDVTQTELGWVFAANEPGYGQNRGCMSQWGARCLENNNDYGYDDILRFYYGADIELTQAQGPCVLELGGDGDGDGDGDSRDGDGDSGDGDGDGGPDPDTGEACSIGALGCECTMGGGCDPGLICIDGNCLPEGPSEGESGQADGDSGDTGGLWQDDGFGRLDEQGCACSADEPTPRGTLGPLALLGLFGVARTRFRSGSRSGSRSRAMDD